MATAIRELDSLEEWTTEWNGLSSEIKNLKVSFGGLHFALYCVQLFGQKVD